LRQDELETKLTKFFIRNNINDEAIVYQQRHKIEQTFNSYEWLRCCRESETNILPQINVLPIVDLLTEIATYKNFVFFNTEKAIREELHNRLIKIEISKKNKNCYFHNRIKNNVCPLGENNRLIEGSIDFIRRNWRLYINE